MLESNIFSHSFSDPDELETFVNSQQYFHVLPLDSQTMEIEILRLQLDKAALEFRTLNIPLRVRGDKKTDTFVFELPLSPILDTYISHGFAIDLHTLYGFDNTRDIDLVLPAGLLMGALEIKREVLEEYLQIMGRDDLNDRFFAHNYIQVPTNFVSVQNYLRDLYGLVKDNAPFLRSPDVRKLILEDYLPLMLDAIPSTKDRVQKPEHFLKRSQLVRKAEEYMRSHLGKPITLKDLCQILQSNKSSLSYGFQEIFGMSPMAYLKLLRIYGAYKALKVRDPTTTTVTEIAQHFGFWNTGRFSQYYKELVGKLPSETINKS